MASFSSRSEGVSNEHAVIDEQLTKLLIRVTPVVILGGFYGSIVTLNWDLRLAGTGFVVVVNNGTAWNIVGAHGDDVFGLSRLTVGIKRL